MKQMFFVIFLAVLAAIFGGFVVHYYHKSIPIEKMKQCTVDSDCVGVYDCTCGCSGGGKGYDDAINKAYTATWDWQKLCKLKPNQDICLQVVCTVKTPKCISSKCQLK